MANKRLIVAGAGSGVGKTTVTIGLMAALQQRGLTVQGFKCGPDYIDPTYHTAVTGRVSRNLDSWMLSHEVVREILAKGSTDADISIIEGVMGLFDGKEATSDRGSTAEISILTRTPVLLVVNCQSMARSAAAVVKGFQLFNPDVRIAAVLANKVGSVGHYQIVKAAIEQECNIPVLGYLLRESDIEIPERHLGLVPSVERGELDALFQRLGELITSTIDLDRLMEIAEAPELTVNSGLFTCKQSVSTVKIAVAKDAAFHFYYPENFELLEAYGAELLFFSPLAGETVPLEADGLYIGGGFPEEFAQQLSQDTTVLESFRQSIRSGIPTLAECGGFMYLTEAITTTDGQSYPMVGLIPGTVAMQKRLAALGYREVTGQPGNFLFGEDTIAKGHEFHYSTFASSDEITPAYQTKGLRGTKTEGFVQDNLVAGYTHLHFASCPELVERWIQACLKGGVARGQ
ncbi:cobyrinate a,c-diamide synthase [Brevibacillus ginsengisoli]|uniref:cobyrinate a,c-diamide synthase n=1 Tax=Brevibacillus ginsengisoli TaxID=363854 RepID=UPI003CFB1D3A